MNDNRSHGNLSSVGVLSEGRRLDRRAFDRDKWQTGITGKIYPNGEFTAGIVPPKRVTDKERNYDAKWHEQYECIEGMPIACDEKWQSIEGGVMAILRWRFHLDMVRRCSIVTEKRYIDTDGTGKKQRYRKYVYLVFRADSPRDDALSNIGLSSPINSHKQGVSRRKPRGRNGITSRGKRSVRNGAWLLQRYAGRKRLGFLTVTLPSFPDRPDIQAVLAIEWSEMVRQFLQELTRAINRKDRDAHWVGCTEIQEKRLRRSGDACPHLHIVYVSHDGDYRWYVTASELRAIWKRIVDARVAAWLDEDIDSDTSAAIDCQSVKRDASAYLSKYLSKGSDIIEEMESRGLEDAIPSAWWHCCLRLKRAIAQLTDEMPNDIKLALRQKVDLVTRGVCHYVHDVTVRQIINIKTGSRLDEDGKMRIPIYEDREVDRVFGWVGKFVGMTVSKSQIKAAIEG